jgi:hypothetical protein
VFEFGLYELVRSKLLAPTGLPCLSSGFEVEPLLVTAGRESLEVAFGEVTRGVQSSQ